MCCCAIECVQCTVYFLNIILMLSGIGLLIASIVLFINGFAGSLSMLVPSLPYVYVAILLLIAAIIILCVSFYGCMVAFKGDVCALIWYYVLVVIVLCLEASVLVMTFTHWREGGYHPQIRDYINQRAQQGMGRYGTEGEEKFTSLWDDLQIRKQCCGVISHLDWYKFHNYPANRPPDSCCETYYEGCSKSVSAVVIWDEGCEDYLVNETFRGLGAIGTIVIIVFIMQVILLLFVLILIFLHKFGNDPKNTCCGGITDDKPEDLK